MCVEVHESTVDAYNIQGLPLFALFVDGKCITTASTVLLLRLHMLFALYVIIFCYIT